MKSTIYLLTGAAGFLGSNICKALITQKKQVRALALQGDPAVKMLPAGIEIVYGDLLDNISLEKFFDVPQQTEIRVIHCASMVTVDPNYNAKVYAVNVEGTQNIIEHCIKSKAAKLVYISSTSAIPELPKGSPIKEVSKFDPNSVVGCYGKSKALATQAVMDAVVNRDLDASIVFPSGICGPNDYANGYYSSFITEYANGEMPAGISGSFNAVDARDLADAIITCTQKGRAGEGYIMGNELVGIGDIFKMVSRLTGCKEVKTILPIPVAKVLSAVMSFVSKLTGKPPMLTSYAIYNLDRNNAFDSKKAAKELGYKTRPFEESINDTILWLAEEGKLKHSEEAKQHCLTPCSNIITNHQ